MPTHILNTPATLSGEQLCGITHDKLFCLSAIFICVLRYVPCVNLYMSFPTPVAIVSSVSAPPHQVCLICPTQTTPLSVPATSQLHSVHIDLCQHVVSANMEPPGSRSALECVVVSCVGAHCILSLIWWQGRWKPPAEL